MSERRTFVIVGAGFAGARAAITLRAEGFDGRVLLLGDEPVRPYDRVTLSKHYLYGKPGLHSLFVHDETFYAAHNIELRVSTPVVAVDVGAWQVELASGERIGYDALLLTTGCEPRRWAGPGSGLGGVHYLRTLADADRLRAALVAAAAHSGRLVVVGTGWIGCEIAAAARELGIDVALVGRSSVPLEHQLGARMAGFYRDLHAEHGVELYGGREVTELRGQGSVRAVVLSDGTVLPADVVVFGIGARPRVGLARAAGLTVDNGIMTDAQFATSAPRVFAAGDVANVWNGAQGRRTRLEHWAAALRQGPAAARAMLGDRHPYSQIPFFFTDQYDVWMEVTGETAGADEFVTRTLPGDRAFIAFWLRGGRLAAGMNVNIKGIPDLVGALISGGRRINARALADPDIPLADTVLSY